MEDTATEFPGAGTSSTAGPSQSATENPDTGRQSSGSTEGNRQNNNQGGPSGNGTNNNNQNQRGPNVPPLNRNNQGRNLATIREHLFQALFFRATVIYARAVPPPLRRFFEFIILLEALMMLSLLVYIHVAFVQSPITCLVHLNDTWPKDGILRVEVIKNPETNYSLKDSYFKEDQLHQHHLAVLNAIGTDLPLELFVRMFEKGIPPLDFNDAMVLNEEESTDNEGENSGEEQLPEEDIGIEEDLEGETVFRYPLKDQNESFTNGTASLPQEEEEAASKKIESEQEFIEPSEEEYIVEYSLEHGFLKLSPATRERLNISVQLVVLDPTNDTCFGDALSRIVLDNFLGYDDILLKSLKGLIPDDTNTKEVGFIRNVVTGDHYRFVNIDSGINYLYAAFVMVVFTLNVSMLLRYSHHQIFLFIIHLLQMLELNVTVSFPGAPMLMVILALVGMEAIMSEFFRDTSTAFYVIVVIWLSDQYEAICCHTPITKKYWLRFFYLYHFAFYVYHYKYNGQYSGIALMTSWLFILHSKLYFFHHYELPALLQQAQVIGRIQTLNIVLRNPPPERQGQQPHGAATNNEAGAVGGTNDAHPPPETGNQRERLHLPEVAANQQGQPRIFNVVLQNAPPPHAGVETSLRFILQNLRNIMQNARRRAREPNNEQQETERRDTSNNREESSVISDERILPERLPGSEASSSGIQAEENSTEAPAKERSPNLSYDGRSFEEPCEDVQMHTAGTSQVEAGVSVDDDRLARVRRRILLSDRENSSIEDVSGEPS